MTETAAPAANAEGDCRTRGSFTGSGGRGDDPLPILPLRRMPRMRMGRKGSKQARNRPRSDEHPAPHVSRRTDPNQPAKGAEVSDDPTAAPQPDAVTKVARNLSAIEDMTAQLLTQAVHSANDREIPGGLAMVSLASVASPEAWEHIFEACESNGRDTTYAKDQDDVFEPPLQTLLFWSERWRADHGYELDRRPTIASEANFIRWCLNWAWDHEANWDDFARDIHKARLRLEDVLHDGRRAERSRVVCPDCEVRLIHVYGDTAADDRWKCPACKTRLDDDDFRRAHARQLRSQGAERYVSLRDAIGTLKAQGRPERTIRKWFADCQVQAWCDARTREVMVWWPDLWRLHLTTQTRDRKAAS